MDNSLTQAYQQAHYAVRFERYEKAIGIGKVNHWLDRLLLQYHQNTAAFITASNPKSEIQSEKANRNNNHQLQRLIERANYPFFSGYSSDKSGAWPREESFLVIGISQRQSDQLARQFFQNAYLWGAAGNATELRWLEY